jgi:hypothetical protein
MKPPARWRNFAFAYGAGFSLLYPVVIKLDLALFTVYPSLGVVLLGTHRSRDVVDPALGFLAPTMYWYGWTATSALGALLPGLVAMALPKPWIERALARLIWALPAVAMLTCGYLTLPWFRL